MSDGYGSRRAPRDGHNSPGGPGPDTSTAFAANATRAGQKAADAGLDSPLMRLAADGSRAD